MGKATVGLVMGMTGNNDTRQSLGFVTNGSSFPTTRIDGSPIQIGDYVVPAANSSFPFDVGNVTFPNKKTDAVFIGNGNWTLNEGFMQYTDETPLKNKTMESLSGTAENQAELNREIKVEFSKKENTDRKIQSFDDLEEGDITSYPNADAVKKLNAKNIPGTRKVAGITLENDITVQDLINTFKDIARTYKNVTIDCDDNEILNIIVGSFKAGEVYSSMPQSFTAENYKLITAKAIFDFVKSQVQGAIKIKGVKQTKAEILALTDMEVNDEWRCEEDSRFWLYTEEDGWVDNGGAIDFSLFVLVADIVNNCNTNDANKPLSAAMGKYLKELIDGKQDEIDITDYSNELATLNPTHLFVNRKLLTMLGVLTANIEGTLQTPITNITDTAKEIARFPVLDTNYSYPTQTRIDITQPSGYYYCLQNKHEFYDNDGDHYVDPDVASTKEFTLKSALKIDGAFDNQGNPIFIAEWKKNSQNMLIMTEDGKPVVDMDDLTYIIDGDPTAEPTQTPDAYVLKYTAGQGYTQVNSYFNDQGQEIVGNFLELVKITPTINKQYMYQCYLMKYMINVVGSNFLVDSQGRLCKFKITEDEYSKILKPKQANVISSFFEGLNGTVVIEPINHAASYTQINGSFVPHETVDEHDETIIDYYSLMVGGSKCLTNFVIQKSL